MPVFCAARSMASSTLGASVAARNAASSPSASPELAKAPLTARMDPPTTTSRKAGSLAKAAGGSLVCAIS